MIIRKNYGFRTSYLCIFIFDWYYRLITIYQRRYFEGLIPFNYAWVLRQSRLRRIYFSSIAVSKCDKYLVWILRKEYTFNNFDFYIFILLFLSFRISQIIVWRQVVKGLEHGYWCKFLLCWIGWGIDWTPVAAIVNCWLTTWWIISHNLNFILK